MWPALTVSIAEIQLSSVVFPEPDAPHNTEKFSGLNGKADILNGLRDIPFIAIVFLDMFQFQNGTHVSDLLKFFLYWIINGLGIFLYQVFLHSSYRNVRIAEPVSSVPR